MMSRNYLCISKLKGEDEIEWEFSEKFENSMNKLIRKNIHIRLSTRRTVRRGLLAAITALIAVFSGLMSVSATREPIVNFVKRVFSDHNEMTMSCPLTESKRNIRYVIYPKSMCLQHMKKMR